MYERIMSGYSRREGELRIGMFRGVDAALAAIGCVSAATVDNAGASQVTRLDVFNGTPNHFEVVEFEVDPDVVRFEQTLDPNFTLHDCKTLNRRVLSASQS